MCTRDDAHRNFKSTPLEITADGDADTGELMVKGGNLCELACDDVAGPSEIGRALACRATSDSLLTLCGIRKPLQQWIREEKVIKFTVHRRPKLV